MKQNKEKSLRISAQSHAKKWNNPHLICHTAISCHLKQSEVSQAKSNRDISLSLNMTNALNMTKSTSANVQNHLDISVSTKPQYDNVGFYAKPQYDKASGSNLKSSPSLAGVSKPISSPSLAEGARGWVDTTSQQLKIPHANQSKYTPHASDKKTTTPTTRKLALSLLTASALASASLELAIAGDCVILQHSSVAGATSKRVECTGSFSASEFQSKLETAGKSAQSGLFFYRH